MSGEVRCPWCGEDDFDAIGLKGHISMGDCEPFNSTEAPPRLFAGIADRCPAQEPPAAAGWRLIDENTPRDGATLLLLIRSDGDEWTPTEDEQIWRTVGSHNGDEWSFAGWSWHQDIWIEGQGTPIGWLPIPLPPTTEEPPR